MGPRIVSPCPSDLDRGQDTIYPRHFTWPWKLKSFCRSWRCSGSAVQQGRLTWPSWWKATRAPLLSQNTSSFSCFGPVCPPDHLSLCKAREPQAYPRYLVVVLVFFFNLRPRGVLTGTEVLSQAVTSIRPFMAPFINCLNFAEKKTGSWNFCPSHSLWERVQWLQWLGPSTVNLFMAGL